MKSVRTWSIEAGVPLAVLESNVGASAGAVPKRLVPAAAFLVRHLVGVMTSPVTSDVGRAADTNRWAVLALLGTAQLMVVLDATIVSIALPSAQKALHFSTADREWIVTAYALAFGSLLLLGGKLGDLFGRKWTFIAGLVGFAIVSAIGGLAQNFDTLVSARALQGAFGALLAPSALGLLTVTFAGSPDRAKAFGIFGAIAGGGASVGLVLGGALTQFLSWRWCLYVNLVIAVPTAIFALRLLVNHRDPEQTHIDVPGLLTSSAGLFALVYGFSNAETQSWTATATIVALVASAVLLLAFVVIESRVKHPLLPLHIVRNRARGGAYTAVLLTSAGVFGVFFFLTYYMQLTLGFSPLTAGLAFLPLTGVLVATSVTAQTRVLPRTGAKPLGNDRDDTRGDRHDHLHPANSRRYLRHPRPARAARHRPGHGMHLRARHRNRHPRRRGPRDRRGLGSGQHLPAGRRRRRAGAAEHGLRQRRRRLRPNSHRPARASGRRGRARLHDRVLVGRRHLRHRSLAGAGDPALEGRGPGVHAQDGAWSRHCLRPPPRGRGRGRRHPYSAREHPTSATSRQLT